MITKFNYIIQNEDQIFCDNIDSRHSARNRLREVKSLGFKTAKIVREEFVKISEKVVR